MPLRDQVYGRVAVSVFDDWNVVRREQVRVHRAEPLVRRRLQLLCLAPESGYTPFPSITPKPSLGSPAALRSGRPRPAVHACASLLVEILFAHFLAAP
ncbi:MAG: hypothetical protein ACYC8W_04685 [Candidatus Tyrphobacter sp.]